jgi:hypothetical protein
LRRSASHETSSKRYIARGKRFSNAVYLPENLWVLKLCKFADGDRDGGRHALRENYQDRYLGRVLINRSSLVRPIRCPLCPDSDQILQRSEMSRCANSELMHLSKIIFDSG